MNKSSRVLYVLNAFYPYEVGESFLESEVDYYHGFDKIVFVPIYAHENKGKVGGLYSKPSVELRYLDTSSFKKFKTLFNSFLKTLNSKEFYHEIRTLYKSRRLTFHNLLKMLKFIMRGIYCSDTIIRDMNQNTENNDRVVLYSYWMNLDAYIGARLKMKIKNRKIEKFVTRCHRVDIYEYADPTNYIPMRDYIFKRANYILPISDNGKNYLMSNYGLSEDYIKVMRLGTTDKGVKYSPKGSTLNIISCSWIRPIKRIDLIVNALKNIKVPINWTHYGDGDDFEKINAAIEKIDNPFVSCTLAGRRTNTEILKIYASEDFNVFINVSENEGVPVSIMEAMSFGKIVIATDVGGSGEIVKNKQNGFLLDKDFEVHYLTKVIEEIYHMSSEQYLQMCRESRRIWNNQCNAVANYTEFLNFLNITI